MATSTTADKKRISVLLPAETVEVITATAQIYNCTFSVMVNRILNNFAAQNKPAVEVLAKMQKAARDNFEEIINVSAGENPLTQGELDFGQIEDTKKAAE